MSPCVFELLTYQNAKTDAKQILLRNTIKLTKKKQKKSNLSVLKLSNEKMPNCIESTLYGVTKEHYEKVYYECF